MATYSGMRKRIQDRSQPIQCDQHVGDVLKEAEVPRRDVAPDCDPLRLEDVARDHVVLLDPSDSSRLNVFKFLIMARTDPAYFEHISAR